MGPRGCRVSGAQGCGGSVDEERGVRCRTSESDCVYQGKERLAIAGRHEDGATDKCIDMGACCEDPSYANYPCGARYVGKGGYGAPVRGHGGILVISGAVDRGHTRSLRQVADRCKAVLHVGHDVRTRNSFTSMGRSVGFQECLCHKGTGTLTRDVLLTVKQGVGGLRYGVRAKEAKDCLFPLGET